MQVACACARFASPLHLFFCGACAALRCAHPTCTSVAPASLHCPTCLRRWAAADGARLGGRCPSCAEGEGAAAAAAAYFSPSVGGAAAASALLAALRASPTLAALCGGAAAAPRGAPAAAGAGTGGT